MKKIRINNDIPIRWSIKRNSLPEDFGGKQVAVRLLDKNGKAAMWNYHIEGDKIVGTFRGKDQDVTGVYRLELIENSGSDGMVVLDYLDAFSLVARLKNTTSTGVDDDSSIGTNPVELTSEITTGVTGDYVTSEAMELAMAGKVDVVQGKGLSKNDLTDALLAKLVALQNYDDAELRGLITDILQMVPSTASEENKLADKSFVNSSVATNTATFQGTYDAEYHLHLTSPASHQDIAAALLQEVPDVDNNDYVFIRNFDGDGNTLFERFKYSADSQSWQYEYSLNNSSFTMAQWAAIQSGITETLVAKLSELPTNSEYRSNIASLGQALSNTQQSFQINMKRTVKEVFSYDQTTGTLTITTSDL